MSSRFFRAAYSIAALLLCVGSGTARAQDEMFVTNANNNSVTVYTRTANGNVAPLRTLAGAATRLNLPNGLAVDTVNNELTVVNQGNSSVTVYALTANGNVAPLRTIVGAATGLNQPYGLAVDTVNNELVVANGFFDGSITVYVRTANGNVAPLRTLSGAATGLNLPIGLAVDTVNNELAVSNNSGSWVTVYARTANGNVAPLRTLVGAATGLNAPIGLAVDTVNNELAVANNSAPSVTVYARTANGNVAPLRTIVGAATGLNFPIGLTVDTVNNELAVANNLGSVTAYARTANGNVPPLRTLMGAATGLNSPSFLARTTGAGVQPAGLVEDTHATGGTISNVNNVLEPGETVLVNPSWKNATASPLAVTGTASAFTGPAGATYTLLDSVADYGTIAPGATTDSFSAGTGLSYRLEVSVPSIRPATHWDATFLETMSTGIPKTWTLHIGQSFSDVPVSDGAYPFVENIFHNGITAGCGGGNYCPASNVTRWQMAVFLATGMVGPSGTVPTSGTVPSVGSYDCTSGGNSLFGDVPPIDLGCRFIHYIYSQGLTAGCGGGNYCPAGNVTRWQMAVFLATGMVGPSGTVPTSGTVPSVGSYDCTSGGNSLFGDVPPTDPGCRFIHYIYANGVTAGCGGGNFCPASNVTRWQMAPFLVTAFKIPFLQ